MSNTDRFYLRRRTFEALKYPKGSATRAKLNESSLTSEYMPSLRYELLEFIPASDTHTAQTIKKQFRTKKQAVEYRDRREEMGGLTI